MSYTHSKSHKITEAEDSMWLIYGLTKLYLNSSPKAQELGVLVI